MVKGVAPYAFDVGFEAALATALCFRPKLYSRVGAQIESEALASPTAQLLVRTAQACAKDSGNGPDATVLIIQRLRRMQEEGKVTREEIVACADYMDEAEVVGIPNDDAILTEVIPVLRRRASTTAIHEIIDAHGKQRDLSEPTEQLVRAGRIGETEVDDLGTSIGANSFQTMGEIHCLKKLPLGVPELDTMMHDGLWRGALGVIVASTGGGKSMYLSHQTASAMLAGYRVAYITLELPRAVILARIIAVLVNMPIDAVLKGSEEAQRKLEALLPKLGRCIVKEFTPYVTTVEDVKEWVQVVRQEEGADFDLIATDYGDKLGVRGRDDKSDYDAGRVVFEGLRVWAKEEDYWSWTGSQANRAAKDAKKKVDIQHISDSLHKARVADLVLTATESITGDEITWNLAKHRMAKAHKSLSLPHEFEYGRVAPAGGYLETEEASGWQEW